MRLLSVAILLTFCIGVSSAQLGLKSIGGGAGYVSGNLSSGGSSETMGGFAIGAAANLGDLVPGLALVPEVGYWTASKSVSGLDWSISDFVINGNVSFRFDAGGKLVPYVGGGLGLNFFSTTVDIPAFFGFGGGKVSGSETQLGINILGGLAFPLNDKMAAGIQGRYVISSDLNHFMILATYSYALGN